MVGQRFIQLLEDHPWFEIEVLAASKRSAGKPYKEAAKWHLDVAIPDSLSGVVVEQIDPKIIDEFDLDFVFSAVPSDIAKEIEQGFAEKVPVFSNTATHRMDDDVPLVIPEVNPEHLDLVNTQKERRNWEGFIITNPNCSAIGLTIPLKPLYTEFGINSVEVTTMQALSGAGYAGVPSMAIVDNVIPFISNEEEKMEIEPLKILGGFKGDGVEFADFSIFASCNRVGVLDGHTESVFVNLNREFEIAEVKSVLNDFTGEPQRLKLPSAPEKPIIVMDEVDRPQPRMDRNRGRGMSVSVGRLNRKGKVLKFLTLSHNTIRGAAGASILNAELTYKKGLMG